MDLADEINGEFYVLKRLMLEHLSAKVDELTISCKSLLEVIKAIDKSNYNLELAQKAKDMVSSLYKNHGDIRKEMFEVIHSIKTSHISEERKGKLFQLAIQLKIKLIASLNDIMFIMSRDF